MLDQKYVNRFWTYVNVAGPDDCWEWTGAKTKRMGHGYFNIKLNGKLKQTGAHRVSLMIQGITIPQGMVVMHSCDNPRCVNPNHLQLGTFKDNTYDMMLKGRAKHFGGKDKHKGENHPNAILNENIVKQIKSEIIILDNIPGRKTNKTNFAVIAKKYNVSIDTIRDIGYGKTWTHVI
jgi:hypothetical protein